FGEHDDAADLPAWDIPRSDFPASPIRCPIETIERIFLAGLHRAGQASPMNLFPPFWNLRKNFVMAAADDVLLAQVVIRQPPAAGQYIAHITVEHGNRCRRMLDKQANPVLVLSQRVLGSLAFGNISIRSHPLAHTSIR